MVKECKVINCNEYMTLVWFDEVMVQLPAIPEKSETVFVKLENGVYSLTDKKPRKRKNVVKGE